MLKFIHGSQKEFQKKVLHPSTIDERFYLIYFIGIYDLKFKGICLKQNSVSFLLKNTVDLYITYKLDPS